MRPCALSELEINEIVYVQYPNMRMGTARVTNIDGRKVHFKHNWENDIWHFAMTFDEDYSPTLQKIRCDWDSEVNV